MKVFDSSNCSSSANDVLTALEANQILTSDASYELDQESSVLIDFNGNVIQREWT